MTGTLIVGLGSPHGDDRVGWDVADALMSTQFSAATTVRRSHVPLDLLDWIHESDYLILCDAMVDPDHPGQVQCWKWPNAVFSQCTASGSHDYNLPQVLELATTLRLLPAQISLWTISIQNDGDVLPDSIRNAAIASTVASIRAEIETFIEVCASNLTGRPSEAR